LGFQLQETKIKKYGVLIVDDEPDICESLAILLESNEFKCFSANTAASGFTTLENNLVEIDVLLTDIVMPGESGIDLISRIHKSTYNIPIVILSGFNDKDLTKQALRLGVFDMVDKPYNSEHLLEVLREAIKVTENQFSLVEQSNVSEEVAALASLNPSTQQDLPEAGKDEEELFWDLAKGQVSFCFGSIGIIKNATDNHTREVELSFIIRVLNALSESSKVKEVSDLNKLVNALGDFCSSQRVDILRMDDDQIALIKEGLEILSGWLSGLKTSIEPYFLKIK
jgi:YesN/AraC family two-component response regulator